MLSRFSYIEQNAVKKRVLYEGTSVIYQGMPVCYNYNTTDNIDGYDIVDGAGGTTDESHQNEGKHVRVEDPANNNIMHFAGVVAGTEHEGVTGTGEKWLEIYIPNGAVVPVRCDVDTTVGVTLLAITVSSQEFGLCVAGTSRIVALAMETETALDGTAGITLARLDTAMSVYQNLDGTALSVGAGSGNIVANSINLTSAQTGGRFCAFEILATVTGTPANTGYGISLYVQTDVSGIMTGQNAGVSLWTNFNAGGDITGDYYGVEIGLYESGADLSGIASSDTIAPLCLRTQLDTTNPPSSKTHYMMYLRAETAADPPDGLFAAYTSYAFNGQAKSSAAVSHVIPIEMKASQSGGWSAGTYYIMVSDTL